MDWMSNLTSVQQLQLPDRIRQAALLITTSSTGLVQDAVSTAAGRSQLQATLCSAMLHSLQTNQAQNHISRRTAPSTATQPSSLAATAAQPEPRAACINSAKPAVELGSTPADTTYANMDHPQPLPAPLANTTPTQSASLADAWRAAGAALQVLYKWEDDEVVQGVIAFWVSLCDILQESWLEQLSDCTTAPTDNRAGTTAGASGTTADSNSVQQQQRHRHAQQVAYIRWLLQLGHPTLSAVVALLHDFYCLTGISPLQHKQRTPLMHLLLLFLQVGGSSSSSSSSAAAASIPVHQLLHTVQWPAVQRPHTSSTYQCHAEAPHTAVSAGEALKPHEAFTAVLKLLQSASTYSPSAERIPSPPAAAAEQVGQVTHGWSSSSSTSSSRALWLQLGKAAGQFLQAAYGWGLPGAASAGGRTTPEATHGRPFDTPYDLYMLELFYSMLKGPWHSSTPGLAAVGAGTEPSPAATTSRRSKQSKRQQYAQEQQWAEWCSSAGFRALAELIVGYDKPQQLVSSLVALALHQLQQQQQQEQAQAKLQGAVSRGTYTEKQAMSKVMLLLQQTYLWQQAGVTADNSSNSNGSDCHLADSARVRQLLLGCAELLRPAANCSVEWRCAALELMTAAVEQFRDVSPDDGVLCTKLWCSSALEGLCYCLNHDTSIRVRRAAMKLLQMVALPAGSPAALQLLQTLATKACDKDSHVAVSALSLLVQLDSSVLCSCLSLEQFSGVVQAGLQWCSAASNGINAATGATAAAGGAAAVAVKPMEVDATTQLHAAAAIAPVLNSKAALPLAAAAAGGRQQSKDALLPSASQKQFLQLLRDTLLCDAAAVQRTTHQVQEQGLRQWLVTNAHRVVGEGGCRLLLLLLLTDSRLKTACERLSHQVAAAS